LTHDDVKATLTLNGKPHPDRRTVAHYLLALASCQYGFTDDQYDPTLSTYKPFLADKSDRGTKLSFSEPFPGSAAKKNAKRDFFRPALRLRVIRPNGTTIVTTEMMVAE